MTRTNKTGPETGLRARYGDEQGEARGTGTPEPAQGISGGPTRAGRDKYARLAAHAAFIDGPPVATAAQLVDRALDAYEAARRPAGPKPQPEPAAAIPAEVYQSGQEAAAVKPTIGRIVWYSTDGESAEPAIITATNDTLNQYSVYSGDIPDLDSDEHVHLTVFSPYPAVGTYVEHNVPHGTTTGCWRWPDHVNEHAVTAAGGSEGTHLNEANLQAGVFGMRATRKPDRQTGPAHGVAAPAGPDREAPR